MTDEDQTPIAGNGEIVSATLTQSSTIKPVDTQVNGEIVSTTPKETTTDTPTEQTVADSQVSSTNQVIFFKGKYEYVNTNALFRIFLCCRTTQVPQNQQMKEIH